MIYFSFRRIDKTHSKYTKCQLLIIYWSRKAGLQSKEQYKNKKKTDVHVCYGSSEDIPEDACSLRLYGDSTALKWSTQSRWQSFKNQVLKCMNLFLVKPRSICWLVYFVFSLVLVVCKTWFWFSHQFQNFSARRVANLVKFSLASCFIYLV